MAVIATKDTTAPQASPEFIGQIHIKENVDDTFDIWLGVDINQMNGWIQLGNNKPRDIIA